MKIVKYQIKVPYTKNNTETEYTATLTSYTLDIFNETGRRKSPAVIISPGGGYYKIAEKEAEPVAVRFAAHGIQAFVLDYSVGKVPFPIALLELSKAVAFVRENAFEWDIDPENISICGFSAGGHLTASLGVHWNSDLIKNTLSLTDEHKPNSMILCYPVITSGEYTHEGSIINISDDEGCFSDMFSLENHVSKDTPRTFIWHCADDDVVPVENTLFFAKALSKNKINFEAHIYPFGGHGLSLCDETTSYTLQEHNEKCSEWFIKAVNWIKEPNK